MTVMAAIAIDETYGQIIVHLLIYGPAMSVSTFN